MSVGKNCIDRALLACVVRKQGTETQTERQSRGHNLLYQQLDAALFHKKPLIRLVHIAHVCDATRPKAF